MEVVLRLIPFFLLIAAGAAAARTARIDIAGARALSSYVFWIAFPALLIQGLSKVAPPEARMAMGLAAYAASLIAVLLVVMTLGRVLGWSREARVGAGVASMAGNIPFLGAPFAISIFGPEATGVVSAAIAVDGILIVATAGAMLRSISGKDKAHVAVARSLQNPLVIAAIVGAAMSFSGYVLTGPAAKAMDLLAATASPVGLVALGVVVGMEFGKPQKDDVAPVLTGLVFRLILAPIVVWFATGLAGAEPLLRASTTLLAAGPTAVHVFIQTRTLGVYSRGGAMAVVLSTLVAAVTLAVLGQALVGWLKPLATISLSSRP